MALDTRYRPLVYDDVLGQDHAVPVLREIVRSGKGFHQSYIFCGGHGSGKTTLGRILARALLCDNPVGGDPCDNCASCVSILTYGSSESFVEVDAATNSGKEDVKKITTEVQYSTFSGKHHIYLFDESHQMSKQALDALLKPMEDSIPGTENKQLVCIFCTTEPEKMRSTIFSRCAPAFTIRTVPPEGIADRLEYVCAQEGLEYEREALVLIAEATESHIRDALKAVEKISMLGAVTVDTVSQAMLLNTQSLYVEILAHLGVDLPRVLELAETLNVSVSPSNAYKRLSEVAMMAFSLYLGVGKAPGYMDSNKLSKAGEEHKEYLLAVAKHLSEHPNKPSQYMFRCDLATLHMQRIGKHLGVPLAPLPTFSPAAMAHRSPDSHALPTTHSEPVNTPASLGKVSIEPPASMPDFSGGSIPEPKAAVSVEDTSGAKGADRPFSLELFRTVLHHHVAELREAKRGSSRRSNMGRN